MSHFVGEFHPELVLQNGDTIAAIAPALRMMCFVQHWQRPQHQHEPSSAAERAAAFATRERCCAAVPRGSIEGITGLPCLKPRSTCCVSPTKSLMGVGRTTQLIRVLVTHSTAP